MHHELPGGDGCLDHASADLRPAVGLGRITYAGSAMRALFLGAANATLFYRLIFARPAAERMSPIEAGSPSKPPATSLDRCERTSKC